MNPNKHTKQDKKINPEDSFVKWWQRHKTLIAILSVFISFTVGFNLFLYQWVITPMAEKRVLDAEIEFVKNAKCQSSVGIGKKSS